MVSKTDRNDMRLPPCRGIAPPLRIMVVMAALSGVTRAAGMDLDRIEQWFGSGTNRAGMVVDWHDGSRVHALAWGFRWNGSATSLDLWQAATNAPTGLSGRLTNTLFGPRVTAVEYRRPRRPGDRLPQTGPHDVFHTAYAFDHTGAVFRTGAWTHWTGAHAAACAPPSFSRCATSLTARILINNGWDAWTFTSGPTPRPPGFAMAAVGYPFAVEVRHYAFGDSVPAFDWLSGENFTNAHTALGRPTVCTTGDDTAIPRTQDVPVVPVYAAFRSTELVSIGENGVLELAFDHPVFDHPDNPWGADLLVFGNTQQVIDGSKQWTNGPPAEITTIGQAEPEPGSVSVSQDGINWLALTNGPYADDFAPTLGRVYDPNGVNTNPGDWNHWWGGPTDPTVPVAPDLTPTHWAGMSVADIALRYRGSAGGTPFDIAELDLPAHPDTGLKWIQYIRVTRSTGIDPEVDAVADVSPAAPSVRWAIEHFPWAHNPAEEKDAGDPDGDGLPNLLEYGLGRDPTLAEPDPAYTMKMSAHAPPPSVEFHYRVDTRAGDVQIRPAYTDSLGQPAWTTNGLALTPAAPPASNHLQSVVGTLPLSAEASFFQLRAHRDE